MRIAITGADGFIGKNLRLRLAEAGMTDIACVMRETSRDDARALVSGADFVFHLAGVNRPVDPAEFQTGNAELTASVCEWLSAAGRAPIVFTSSTQAEQDNPYGQSKRAAEDALRRYEKESGAPVTILRLPNVFGKWARPNYNSAVATFCHNLSRGLPITIHDPNHPLRLAYVDDVVNLMISCLDRRSPADAVPALATVYETTVGAVADKLRLLAQNPRTLIIGPVGTGLARALYATYVSYLPPEQFSYPLTKHADARGVFVEMLKTMDAGQFSYFTAGPGITRGGHYHHTKTEKFLVVKGRARFGFRHMVTNEAFELETDGEAPRVVETVPGWAHDITNIGNDEMVVMLWANEIFDPQKPDTITARIRQ